MDSCESDGNDFLLVTGEFNNDDILREKVISKECSHHCSDFLRIKQFIYSILFKTSGIPRKK